jgi:hypothetical protein
MKKQSVSKTASKVQKVEQPAPKRAEVRMRIFSFGPFGTGVCLK